jgi:hypothetical protein
MQRSAPRSDAATLALISGGSPFAIRKLYQPQEGYGSLLEYELATASERRHGCGRL